MIFCAATAPTKPADEKPKQTTGAASGPGGVARGGGRGRRGKGGKERGAILLTALEQEMVDWAVGGFQPSGPQGIQPLPGMSCAEGEG